MPITYSFTTVDDPLGTIWTIASGINDSGQVSGVILDNNNPRFSGFIYSGGTFIPINDPLNTGGGTAANGINNAGQVVGYYNVGDVGSYHGFLYSNGTYTTLDDPAAAGGSGTIPNGINNLDQIVGAYTDSAGVAHGFLYSNGTYTNLDDPLASGTGPGDTGAQGINDAGTIVGVYHDNLGIDHGYVDNNGVFTTLDDPLGTRGTILMGINNAGEVSGRYYDSSNIAHGFVYSNGVFTTDDDPLGTNGTAPQGINNLGQVAGNYVDSSGNTHGFVASPVAPFDEWTNSSGGNWTTASNWSLGVPTASVQADIDATGTYSVNIDTAATAYALLLNDSGATVTDNGGKSLSLVGNGGSGNPNGALTINSGTFDLTGGALNAGSIGIASGGDFVVSGNYNGSNALSETISDNGSFDIIKSSIAKIAGPITGLGSRR
jgi:probable HAF family extracellular repeat protein